MSEMYELILEIERQARELLLKDQEIGRLKECIKGLEELVNGLVSCNNCAYGPKDTPTCRVFPCLHYSRWQIKNLE